MSTELTDAAIEQKLESHGLHVPHFTTSRNKMLSAVRAAIAADRALQGVTVAYCNTGWAAPGWELRVAEGEALALRLGFETVHLQSMGMEALVRMKHGFPGHGAQFCTAWLNGCRSCNGLTMQTQSAPAKSASTMPPSGPLFSHPCNHS